MTAHRAVGLGEGMLRLSAEGQNRLGQTQKLNIHSGVSELNIVSGLTGLGLQARWLTRLADNPLGRRIARRCR